jgi:preprotein translocase subunit SecF
LKGTIRFLRYKYIAFAVSLTIAIVCLAGTFLRGGLNWGIDFMGGVKITAAYPQGKTAGDIRSALSAAGISASVQQVGEEEKNEYIIATKLLPGDTTSETTFTTAWDVLSKTFPGIERLSVETVGPAIGAGLRKDALRLGFWAILTMMLYLAFRFELKYSVGAMLALVHDITLAVLFCGFAGVEIDVPVIAALLTIFGYSVNDTIVIFDRIREMGEHNEGITGADVIDSAINKSISRTLLTSLTTLFAVVSLYVLGGDVINSFAKVLLFGIIVGTYSSIYIASPIVMVWGKIFTKKK